MTGEPDDGDMMFGCIGEEPEYIDGTGITGVDGLEIVSRHPVSINRDIVQVIEFRLYQMQDSVHEKASREQINKLMKDHDEGATFPPLIVMQFPGYVHVLDGQHRALALYYNRVFQHPAVWVTKE